MLNNNNTGNIPAELSSRLAYVGRYTASNAILAIPNIDLDTYDYVIFIHGYLNETTDFVFGFPDLSTWTTRTRDNSVLNYGGAYLEWSTTFCSTLFISKRDGVTTLLNCGVGGGAYSSTTATGTSFVFHKYRSSLGALVDGSAIVYRCNK